MNTYRTNTYSPSRRTFIIAAALLAGLGDGAAFAQNAAPPSAATQLRIGYQKYGTLTLLRARGTLDKRLAAQGIKVTWIDFPAGPQLLEGLNVGSIDFGTVGEAPPIFALAAGAPFVYVGSEPPAPAAEAIVVPKDSLLKSVADLRGKRVALNKGSNVHYLLVRLLEKAGVAYNEIQPVYLTPADARAAFERGAVDAWAIWDPFFAAAQEQLGARVLADGNGAVNNAQYFLASKGYAQARPDVLSIVVDELKKADAWAATDPKAVATILSTQLGLAPAVVARSIARFSYGVQPVGPDALADQQRIADAFYKLKLIPRPVKVADAAWQPPAPQKVSPALGPVHAISADRVVHPRGWMQGAGAQQGSCLASGCNAADGPSDAQPGGKGSFGPSLGVAFLARAASPCSVARLDGQAKTALRDCGNSVNRP